MPRNSNGDYSLPAGNPVVTGTTISSTWANSTLADIAAAVTDSLSRSGDGSMLAPLLLDNGTIGAPSLSWGNETTAGWYRAGAGDFRYSIGGADKFQITSTAITPLVAFRTADGTAALPAYSFTSDPNTGVYSVGADQLGFSTNGVLRLTVSTTAVIPTLPITAADGLVGTPTFTFASDPDTGIYRRGANLLSFSANGVLAFEVQPAQVFANVGSASAPGYSFFGSSGAGVYLQGSTFLGLAHGGLGICAFYNLGVQIVTGQFLALDGSAAAPGYSFSQDLNTGIFRNASGLTFAWDGTPFLQSTDTSCTFGANSGFSIGFSCLVSASASAGGGAALPATIAGYLAVVINGTSRKIPYYAT